MILLLLPLTVVFPHPLFYIDSCNCTSTGSIKVTDLHQQSNHIFLLVVQYSVVSVSWSNSRLPSSGNEWTERKKKVLREKKE